MLKQASVHCDLPFHQSYNKGLQRPSTRSKQKTENPEQNLAPLYAPHSLLKSLLSTGSRSVSEKTKWQAFFSNLRTSSTIKPFDLASWVRKLLLLRPIFLSTRYSLTSSNFTPSRPETVASAGLDLFLARGTTGARNISFEAVQKVSLHL